MSKLCYSVYHEAWLQAPTKIQAEIERFMASELELAEVIWEGNYASAQSCANVYRNNAKNVAGINSVKIVTKEGKVYMAKKHH